MRGGEFAGVLGVAAPWPMALRAQQPGAKLPTIGFIGPSTADADRTRRAALLERLGELGWVQDRNLKIEFLWADGVVARAGEIAAGYVQQGVSVIVVSGDAQVKAAKNATSAIPIVIAAAADPVGNGLVESLSRPVGNVTGMSRQLTDSTGKRLELLREIVPGRRLAILFNAGNPLTRPKHQTPTKAAQSMGFQTMPAEIRKGDEVQPSIQALPGEP